jgi:hypothetical protein
MILSEQRYLITPLIKNKLHINKCNPKKFRKIVLRILSGSSSFEKHNLNSININILIFSTYFAVKSLNSLKKITHKVIIKFLSSSEFIRIYFLKPEDTVSHLCDVFKKLCDNFGVKLNDDKLIILLKKMVDFFIFFNTYNDKIGKRIRILLEENNDVLTNLNIKFIAMHKELIAAIKDTVPGHANDIIVFVNRMVYKKVIAQ